jgi:hypothetical protein
VEEKRKLMAFKAMQPTPAAREAGYSLSAAREAGYSLSAAREAGYSLSAAREAGYSLSAAVAAGYSLSAAVAAGYSLSAARAAGYSQQQIDEWESIPMLVKPYTRLWDDIKAKRRMHDQSDWGLSECPTEDNLCSTAMCTAGHLVNMAGEIGYKLQKKYGWKDAATMIHYKSSPDLPIQDFNDIPQENALAYIEFMAELEAK